MVIRGGIAMVTTYPYGGNYYYSPYGDYGGYRHYPGVIVEHRHDHDRDWNERHRRYPGPYDSFHGNGRSAPLVIPGAHSQDGRSQYFGGPDRRPATIPKRPGGDNRRGSFNGSGRAPVPVSPGRADPGRSQTWGGSPSHSRPSFRSSGAHGGSGRSSPIFKGGRGR